MKKIFTLFAAAMVSLCVFAEVNPTYGPCPSKLNFALLNADALNKVEIELQLTNTSKNLNGFNMNVKKAEGSESLVFRKSNGEYFSVQGYGPAILQNWTTTVGEDEETGDEIEIAVDDAMREAKLPNMLDNKNSLKDDMLVIIEILSTLDCRFYPECENLGIGKFFINMSSCEDGIYKIIAEDTPSGCSFAYTKAVGEEVCPEPLTAWTADAPVELELQKTGSLVEEVTAISTIAVDQPVDNRIFDLQGRELQSVPEHGIYIQNGKKYVK
ncbi:MAG: hypothetical protein IKW83_04620 [Muribaculaceae bacterium]|nr:hypothetical protein [Muribaculaceae bacterium]